MNHPRHDCRTCSHSNDSHDPLVGCLYPNCMCANKNPARLQIPINPDPKPNVISPDDRQNVSDALRRAGAMYGHPRTRKTRQRRIWRGLLAILGSPVGVALAALMLLSAGLVALAVIIATGA